MAINRRHFLQLSASAAMMGLSGCSATVNGVLIGGYRTRDNTYGVAAIRPSGETLWFKDVPARLHEIAVQPETSMVAAVARRPGKFIELLSLDSGQLRETIYAPDGFIFEGHALWRDAVLWVSAAAENGDAHLLAYDFKSGPRPIMQPSQRINLPGVGPHQVLSIGDSLVVAIGGWHTQGRTILNAEDFNSALLWVNPESGTIRTLASPDKALSLRHLATDGQSIWAGVQYARPHASDTALIYQTQGDNWQPLATPDQGWRIFSGYIGSLAAADGELLATSPQGHHYGRWDLTSGRCVEAAGVLDVCPAAAGTSQWFIASGTGEIRSSKSSWHRSDFFWDNHWTYVQS